MLQVYQNFENIVMNFTLARLFKVFEIVNIAEFDEFKKMNELDKSLMICKESKLWFFALR